MSRQDNNPFGITRDEVLNLCAEKILAQVDESIHDAVFSLIRDKVNAKIGSAVQDAITDTLNKEMERILTSPITPVNIWGETAGKPTNIRDQLLQRAKLFFEENVDGDLRPAGEHLLWLHPSEPVQLRLGGGYGEVLLQAG